MSDDGKCNRKSDDNSVMECHFKFSSQIIKHNKKSLKYRQAYKMIEIA